MNIQHKTGKGHSSFFIEEGGETLAEIVYRPSGDKVITIEHTEVDEKLQGRNIGHQLVERAVNYAREEGLKIRPDCPFAKKLFDREPDWKDVLASNE